MILLDTHVLFWLNAAPEKLSRTATRAIRRAAGSAGLAICSITLWEVAMLLEAGRLRLKAATSREVLGALLGTPGLSVLEITAEIALLSAQFPRDFPGDPADRLISATARVLGLPLVTRDQAIQDSPLLRTIW